MMNLNTMKSKCEKFLISKEVILSIFIALSFVTLQLGDINSNSFAKDSEGTDNEIRKIVTNDNASDVEKMLMVNSDREKAAVEAAKTKVKDLKGSPRIVATSPSVAQICDKLELDLVGVCKSSIVEIPRRYKKSTIIGNAMSPDMEVLKSTSPDWILGPQSLQSDLQPKFEATGSEWAFLNLRSVQGMYRSINEMGEIFGREKQAKNLVDDFKKYITKYKESVAGKKCPKVMILMGLPGSYIIATEESYVGSLVRLAGGENVYKSNGKEFLNVNTEDMKNKEPDIILRTAHALPDQVIDMFDKDFKENDIWKHFGAVKSGKVYDLTYENFGMSASFKYKGALEQLKVLLYAGSKTEIERAKKMSRSARNSAKQSDATKKYDQLKKGANQ